MDAGFHAEFLEAESGAVGQVIEFAIGDLATHEVDGRIVGPGLRGVFENLLNGQQRNVRIPSHAGRIGFDPRQIDPRLFNPRLLAHRFLHIARFLRFAFVLTSARSLTLRTIIKD